jgi:hypothetical protein
MRTCPHVFKGEGPGPLERPRERPGWEGVGRGQPLLQEDPSPGRLSGEGGKNLLGFRKGLGKVFQVGKTAQTEGRREAERVGRGVLEHGRGQREHTERGEPKSLFKPAMGAAEG